jgi:hypothetical protein
MPDIVAFVLAAAGLPNRDAAVLEASALATYVHRVLACRGDTPTLDL